MTKNKSKKSFLKTYAPILLFVFFSAAAAGLWYFAPKAFATTANTTFTVTASVPPACTVTAVTLGFPSYSSGGAVVNGSTTATVTCTSGSTVTTDVTYSGNYGLASGYSTDPAMKGSTYANYLAYQLYETAGGGGTSGTVFPSTNASATPMSLPECGGSTTSNCFNLPGASTPDPVDIDGAIPAGQTVSTDNYIDTVTLNVNF